MAKSSVSVPTISGLTDLLAISWNVFRNNWPVFIIVNILVLLGSVLDNNGNKSFTAPYKPWEGLPDFVRGDALTVILLAAVILAIIAFFYAMTVVLELRAAQGKIPVVSSVAHEASTHLLRLALQLVLTIIIVAIGLVLFIIPGLFAIGRLLVAPYLLVDKNLGVWESIKESNKLSSNYDTVIWVAIAAIILVGIASIPFSYLPVVGGLIAGLIGIAFSAIIAIRYEEIKKHRAAVLAATN